MFAGGKNVRVAVSSVIDEPRAAVQGSIIVPGDAAYDRVRAVFSGAIDRHPGVIARPASARDIARVIAIARDSDVELAVRAGGHSGAGHSTIDGGLVLDLRDMKAIDIGFEGRTAWAEAGLTAGEYSSAVGAHGLATGFGDTG
jgi:FAD/FMN-containing dehydrogenase